MDAIIKDVLGIQYTCIVKSDKSFNIFENNELVLSRVTSYLIPNHWKTEVREAIMHILSDKIKISTSKYDN